MQKILVFLIFIVAPLQVMSQVIPREGSVLNYRLIGFTFPVDAGANHYQIEIARGNYNSSDSFKNNIILSPVSKSNKTVIEVPDFGKNYTWRIVYSGRHKTKSQSALYHFSIATNGRVDTTKMRINILHPAEAHRDDYVFVEGSGTIYDMKGNPVWCLPDSYGPADKAQDIKFTSQGTITFMIDQTGYEINYDGKLLWQTPLQDGVSGDTGSDYYHHEFTRLSNGHYMVLGTQFVWYKRNTVKDSGYYNVTTDITKHTKYNGGFGMKNRGRFGVIVEFDEKGNVVWSWKTLDYLQASDCVNYWPKDTSLRYEPHENAFYFDEKNHAVYLCYRQLSRIIKIDYPSGKVVGAYGEIFTPGSSVTGNALFCNQHSIRRSQDGYLYLFNNNICSGMGSLPSIVMMKEPADAGSGLPATPVVPERVWEYKCTADGPADDKYVGGGFPSGGVGIELADRSMFICMATDYPKLLIVNRDKEILWSALPEKYDVNDKRWRGIKKTYRANIISRTDLEQLIWNAAKK